MSGVGLGVLTPRRTNLVESEGRTSAKDLGVGTPLSAFRIDEASELQLAQPAMSDVGDAPNAGSDAVTYANVADVLAWRSSMSLPIFCGVHVLLLAAWSASATAILACGAKLTVLAVAVGFVKRHVLGTAPQLGPVSVDEIAAFAKRSEALLNAWLQLASSVLTAQDLRLSILTVSALYAFTLAASLMSVGTMVYAAFGLAFGLAPLGRFARPQMEQLRTFAGREAASLGAALTFKHVLCLALGSLVGWLFVGLWTKFVVVLLLPMLLKLYRDRNRQEVQDGLDQLGRSVPSRLSMGAGAVSRLAAHGARMAMDLDLDFFSPASKRAAKRA